MAKTISELELVISAQAAQFQKTVDDMNKSILSIKKNTETAGSSFGKIFSGNLLADFAKKGIDTVASGIVGLGKAMIEANAKQETYATSFNVLLGSAEAAQKTIKDLKEYSSKVPYSFDDVANATNVMLGFGISADEASSNIRMLGDIAAGDKNKLDSLTLAFSQMSSTGKLTGQDLMQMINAGFNPLSEISKTTGKSIAELKEDMSKGAISADMVKEAFKSATSEGGAFFEMAKKQGQTFSGLTSNIQSSLSEVALNLGGPLFETAEGALQSFNDLLADPVVQEALKALGEAIANIVSTLLPMVKSLFEALIPIILKVAQTLTEMSPSIQKLVEAALRLVDAMMPLIEVILIGLLDNIDTVIPLLITFIDLLTSLMPVITLLTKVINGFISGVLKVFVGLCKEIVAFSSDVVNFFTDLLGITSKTPMNMEAAEKSTKSYINSYAGMTNVLSAATDAQAKLNAELEKSAKIRQLDIDLEKDPLKKLKLQYDERIKVIDASKDSEDVKIREREKAYNDYQKSVDAIKQKQHDDWLAAQKQRDSEKQRQLEYDLDQSSKYRKLQIELEENASKRIELILADRLIDIDASKDSEAVKNLERLKAYKEYMESKEDLQKKERDLQQKAFDEEMKKHNQFINDDIANLKYPDPLETTAELMKRDKDKLQEIGEDVVGVMQNLGVGIGEALLGAPEGLKDALKNVLLTVLDFVEKLAVVALVDVIIEGILGNIGKIALYAGAIIALQAAKAAVNSFDVGTTSVPYDQLAKVHRGEMIVPDDFATAIRKGDISITGPTSNNTSSKMNVDLSISHFDKVQRYSEYNVRKRSL